MASKIGRDKQKCKKYVDAGTREKNKKISIAKEDRKQKWLRKYKLDIEEGSRPETNTHKKKVA